VVEFIATFEHLYFRIEGMSNAFFGELFISDLKDETHAHFLIACPHVLIACHQTSLEEKHIVSF
jgi:hypothetical protein